MKGVLGVEIVLMLSIGVLVILVVLLIKSGKQNKELKVKNNQDTGVDEVTTLFSKEVEKEYYKDEIIYENNPKKAIKMFIDDLYTREYEKNQEKGADFERFIGAVYRLAGYDEVILNGLNSGKKKKSDGGIDIIATKNKKRTLIQCKHLKMDGRVTANSIREFRGADSSNECNKILVTTGKLSDEAYKEWKNEKKILIVEQNNLFVFLHSLIPNVLNELEITKDSFKIKQYNACAKCEDGNLGFLKLDNYGDTKGYDFYKCYSCDKKTRTNKD